MVAEIRYINSQGHEGLAILNEPDKVDHSWWSGRRNSVGKYEKTEVTVFQAFMRSLKDCSKIRVKVYENR